MIVLDKHKTETWDDDCSIELNNIMETLRTETGLAGDSICSLNTTENTDELSKEQENELLYGTTGGYGEEDEALSDDSLRLRVSDDEDLDSHDSRLLNDVNSISKPINPGN